MAALPSPWRSPKGEAQYRAAYEAVLNLWPVPYEHRYVTGRYGRTHVVVAGPRDAPPLVLLHADMMSLTMWAGNIADLSRDNRVYAIDVQGQPGLSVPDNVIRSREDAAAWVSEVLDGLGLAKVIMAGMSYGGWHTLNYAICAPERLERIVVLSPGGGLQNERLGFTLKGMAALILPFLPRWVVFDRFANSLFVEDNLRDPIFNALNERLGRLMYLSFRHFRVFKYWASQSIRPHVLPDEELRGMQVPTLLLIGDQESLYDPVRALQRATRLVPNLEAELFPRANHSMTMERHDVVDRRILAFLGSATTAAERLRIAARATVALA